MIEPLTMPQMPGMSATASARRRDRAVARRGADDLDQRPGRHAGPNGAVVRVEASHRDRDARRKPQRVRPFARERPRRTSRRMRVVVQSIPKLRELRDRGVARNAFDGSPPQAVRVHRLVAGRTDAADDVARIVDAGEHAPGTKSASSTQL